MLSYLVLDDIDIMLPLYYMSWREIEIRACMRACAPSGWSGPLLHVSHCFCPDQLLHVTSTNVYTSRFVCVILAQGPCEFSLYRSNVNGWSLTSLWPPTRGRPPSSVICSARARAAVAAVLSYLRQGWADRRWVESIKWLTGHQSPILFSRSKIRVYLLPKRRRCGRSPT